MENSPTIRTESSPMLSCVSAFLPERTGGKKQGAARVLAGVIAAEDWRGQIELPSVEPDSETGKF